MCSFKVALDERLNELMYFLHITCSLISADEQLNNKVALHIEQTACFSVTNTVYLTR